MASSQKQIQFLKDPLPRMTIVEGCISSGKTFICNHKSIEHILYNYTGRGIIFFAGRTLTTLERNVLEPLSLQYGKDFKYSTNQKKASLCGIRIDLEGCNDKTAESKIRGSTAEFILGDELTLWNKAFLIRCMGSLRVPNACFLGTTNPDSPENFVKVDYLDRKEELGIRNIKFDMADNPSLTDEYIRQVSNEYTGVFKERFIHGLWVKAEGLVYSNFNKSLHVVPTVDRNYTQYQISVDYGTYNPFSMGLWGLCNGVWYRVKEYWYCGRDKGVQKDDSQYYQDLCDFAGKLKISRVLVDPSASSFITYARHKGKYVIVHAKNDVIAGINSVQMALNIGKIKINDCCTNFIRECGLYSYDDKASNDTVIQENDHACDETRYFVFTNMLAIPQHERR